MLCTSIFSLRPGTPTQAADTANDEPDGHAGLRGAIERIDDVAIHKAVQLRPDFGRTPGLGMGDFLFDALHQGLAQAQRGHGNPFQFLETGIAGHVVEDARGITAQNRVLGEITEIGVNPGRDRG